jgi:RNA polymerase sigma factor (sigma-70 family)
MRTPHDDGSVDADEPPSARCSFCHRDSRDVGTLVEGPNRDGSGPVYICDDCVELCASILEMEKQHASAPQGEFDESAINTNTQEMVREKINAVLQTLTEREREIVKLRYGLADGYTYTVEEVGQILAITHEAVQEIERRAIAKLQAQHQPPPKTSPSETR